MNEAERLAENLEELDSQFTSSGLCGEAAEELRRLSAINAELEDLVKDVLVQDESMNFMGSDWHKQSIKALEKARQ